MKSLDKTKMKLFLSLVLSIIFLLVPFYPISKIGITGEKSIIGITGESLVLASTIPGKLCFDTLVKGSVMVRSTYKQYDSKGKIYLEGIDYHVDYNKGTITRAINSSIPDFSKNILYGLKDFDHSKFSGYTNHPYFIWIDYVTEKGERLAKPNDQSKYLVRFRKKLETGMPVSIISYGDSITAGGEASNADLRFQYLYGKYLKSIFPKANLTIKDASTPGYSSTQGVDLWDNYIGKTSPDLVLIGWGMNDHNIGGNTPEQFKSNLVKLVRMIKERKKAEVILYSTFPPNNDWHYGSHSMGLFAEATKQAAIESNCAYVDVYNTWITVLKRKDQSSLLGNNINHPNDFGHWLYAQAFEAMFF